MALLKGNSEITLQNSTGLGQLIVNATTQGSATTTDGTYLLNAGGSLTITYFQTTPGTAPPTPPSNVKIIVYYETGTGTLIQTLKNGAPDASGTGYTFTASLGGAKVGTVRIYLEVVLTGSTGGTGDYNVNSDSGKVSGGALIGAATFFTGYMVSRPNLPVISKNAYPAGTRYAYGVAGNENMVFTLNNVASFGNAGVEQYTVRTRHQSAGSVLGTTTVTGTNASASFTDVCDNVYDAAATTYDAEALIVGSSPLTGAAWTQYDTTQANVVDTATVRQVGLFVANPVITITSVTPTSALMNRGEAVTVTFNIQNSRDTPQNLTRSMTIEIRDSTNALIVSTASTGATYSISTTLTSSADAIFDTVGAQWKVATNVADAVNTNANAFKVSSKILMGSSVGSNNKAIRSNYTLLNRIENWYGDTFLSFARGTAFSGQTSITGNVLTPSEVADITVATLRADAGFDDMSGHGNHGVATGPPTIIASWLGAGFPGNAIRFASGQFLDTGTNNSLSSAFTIEFRCNNLTQGFLGRWNDGQSNKEEVYLGVRSDNGFAQGGVQIGAVIKTLTGTSDVRSGSHALAMDYDGATIRLYVDGVVQASLATTGSVNGTNLQSFFVGKIAAAPGTLAAQMLGDIDEVRLSIIARYAGAYSVATSPFLSDDNVQRLYQFDQGRIPFTYTIGSGHAATGDNTGAAKHETFSKNGNTTDDSATSHSVSSLYYVYIRTQLASTLAPASYPNIDVGSNINFVILGDVCNTWVMVTGVRLDQTYINTTGSAVVLQLLTPASTVNSTYSVDTGPVTSNGSRNGYTPDVTINPTAPADTWSLSVSVNFGGNSGSDTQSINFLTPLTSNLVTRTVMPPQVSPGQTVVFYLECEVNDVATQPQTVPVFKIGKVTAGTPDTFADLVASTQLVSVVTGTAVLNGALYRGTFTAPASLGNYELWTDVQLNGNGIRKSLPFAVATTTGFNFDGFGYNGVP